MKKILVLDDSDTVRAQLHQWLQGWGYQAVLCATAGAAAKALESGIDFAIVDVYLDGDRGDELSAAFINEYLDPAEIAYGRFTSAPESVPKAQTGEWVLHKYDVRNNPRLLREALAISLGAFG